MKQMNYSPITALLRRIHRAKAKSDETGIPVKELMDQDRELRKQLQQERRVQEQRRDFMKTAGGIGLGAGLMSASSMALASSHNTQPTIAIVGAGIGGLRTAHRLMQYGMTSTIYEAHPSRVGGRMFSDRSSFSDDRVVEWGGEFISTEHTALRNLVHQLGLKLEDANKLSLGDEETYWVSHNGTQTLRSESELLDVWVDGLYGIMKQALQDAPWQPQYNTVHTQAHLDYDEKPAIQWMADLGFPSSDWVHQLLLTDLVAEYGVTEENSALNLIYLLSYNTRNSGGLPLAGTDERFHIVGGNDQVPSLMADALPDGSIDMGRKLEAVYSSKTVGPFTEGPFTLSFDTGPDVECDVLVLALPLGLLDQVDIDPRITGNFIPEKNLAIANAVTADNGKLQMEFMSRFWDTQQMIAGENVHQAARAYSDPDQFISTWEGEPSNPSVLGLLVDYNGGPEGRTNVPAFPLGAPDNTLGIAKDSVTWGPVNDVDRLIGYFDNVWLSVPNIGGLYNYKATVSNWWQHPLAQGAFTSPVINTMTVWWGAQWASEGDIYFAGEAYDEEFWSYMEGAVRSAERVAKEIHLNY